MSDTKLLNRKHQEAFQMRKGQTHTRRYVWLEKDDAERLCQLAELHGWINRNGRCSGEPSMQKAMEEVIKVGLAALEAQH